MKQLFTTCLLLLTTAVLAFSQNRGDSRSIIRVRLADEAALSVEVDGRNYNRRGSAITVGDLPSGRHRIRVYRIGDYSRRSKAVLVYDGFVRITPRTFNALMVDPIRRSMRIRTVDMDDNLDRTGPNNTYRDEDYDRYDPRDRDGYNDYKENDDIYSRRDNRRDRREDDRSRPSTNQPSSRTFSERDMDDLHSRVKDRIIDADKIKTIQTALGDRKATTAQVRTMLGWLSFDSTKMELAKWMYSHVSDRQDYWKLESEFTFDSSKDELNDYIRDNPTQR